MGKLEDHYKDQVRKINSSIKQLNLDIAAHSSAIVRLQRTQSADGVALGDVYQQLGDLAEWLENFDTRLKRLEEYASHPASTESESQEGPEGVGPGNKDDEPEEG